MRRSQHGWWRLAAIVSERIESPGARGECWRGMQLVYSEWRIGSGRVGGGEEGLEDRDWCMDGSRNPIAGSERWMWRRREGTRQRGGSHVHVVEVHRGGRRPMGEEGSRHRGLRVLVPAEGVPRLCLDDVWVVERGGWSLGVVGEGVVQLV